MPKLKTHKATVKRFKIKKGKIIKRRAGQDHFNARESGTVTRRKRKDVEMSKTNTKIIRRIMGK